MGSNYIWSKHGGRGGSSHCAPLSYPIVLFWSCFLPWRGDYGVRRDPWPGYHRSFTLIVCRILPVGIRGYICIGSPIQAPNNNNSCRFIVRTCPIELLFRSAWTITPFVAISLCKSCYKSSPRASPKTTTVSTKADVWLSATTVRAKESP